MADLPPPPGDDNPSRNLSSEPTHAVLIHGFAVVAIVFRPLRRALRRQSIDARLVRYPSIGLPLPDVIDHVADGLAHVNPEAIVAHSLGCVAAIHAVEATGWTGPIVLLAPPMRTLPGTRFIPNRLRWPFAPLLDHRRLTKSEPKWPTLSGCRVRAIAGRYDVMVPHWLTTCDQFDDHRTLPLTHNGLLFSRTVVDLTVEWIRNLPG